MYVDGASNSRGAGAGIVLLSPDGVLHESSLTINFPASNNEAEYEALISGLKTAEALGIEELVIYSDSQLVVNQLSEEYEARDDRMRTYLSSAVGLIKGFKAIRVEHIPREQNAHADALAGLASACAASEHHSISFGSIDKPSFELEAINHAVLNIELGPSWMDEIITYLRDDVLPTDKKDAHRLRNKAALFWLNPNGKLYRRSFTGPYLLVAHPHQVPGIIEELHAGDSGCHSGGRSLAHRAITQGYWWPTMKKDSEDFVKRCRKCQMFAPIIHQPARDLSPLTSPWPFSQWGMDIVGKLPVAPGGFKFLLTATDYFTKWVEAEPLVTIEESDVIRFVWRNIISRFGVPFAIITDNGGQFSGQKYRALLDEYGIKWDTSTPGYPQGNGQAEAANKAISSGLKRRLESRRGKWAEELPRVLWAYRTTPRRSTGRTPFSLAFGMEAIIPLQIGLPTILTENFDEEVNNENIAADLDLAEEHRENARIKLASYQQEVAKGYNRSVRLRSFKPDDLVWKKVLEKSKKKKLMPNWEGPYRVLKHLGSGNYKLEKLDGSPIAKTWNANNLKKFYG
jgi:ribonuclease HI